MVMAGIVMGLCAVAPGSNIDSDWKVHVLGCGFTLSSAGIMKMILRVVV